MVGKVVAVVFGVVVDDGVYVDLVVVVVVDVVDVFCCCVCCCCW